jgi:outer membrane protein OmpA-like peptidoglycan-associated protein
MHQEDGSISRIEEFGENVQTNNQEYRVVKEIEEAKEVVNQSSTGVIIRKSGPYVTLYIPQAGTTSFGLLKLDSTYPGSVGGGITIQLDTSIDFKKYGTFNTTFNRAKTKNTGTVYGVTEQGFTTNGTVFEKPKIYFGWNKDVFDPTYLEGSVSNATPELSLYLNVLGYILEHDPESKINIVGYTDGSGSSKYNKGLSKRRVDAVTNHFFGKVSDDISLDGRIKSALYEGEKLANGASAKDETLRYVSIEVISDNDYIFFDGGAINASNATPNVASTDPNKFIILEDTTTVAAPAIIKFTYGGEEVIIKDSVVDETSKLSSKSLVEGFHHEKVGELSYLLHEESVVTYSVFNSESEELDVTVDGVASADLDKSTTKVFVSDTETSKTRLNTSSKDVDGNRTFAVSGSIDFRTSRQFDMSVEGNASLAARMKSVPAPQEFLDYISQVLTNSNSSS